jgi:hypothetical protein
MKKLLSLLFVATFAVTAHAIDNHAAADAAKETKKICVDVMKDGKEVRDPKTGKTKQTCKEVKQHQKLEGTKVPEKK